MGFAEKLNRMCRERRYTNQRELAELARVSKSSLNRWLNGASLPDIEEAWRLAKVLGVSVEYLADDEMCDDPRPQPARRGDPDADAIADLFVSLKRSHNLTRKEAIDRLVGEPAPAVLPGRPLIGNPSADEADPKAQTKTG